MSTIADFNGGVAALLEVMGPPRLDIFIKGDPVPRPEGRPFRLTETGQSRLESRARRGDKKAAAQLAKGKQWARLDRWRKTICLSVLNVYKGEPYSCPLFSVMEFFRPRPGSHSKRNPPQIVTTRPDAKNLLWAAEDALNPRLAVVPGTKLRVTTWKGLWTDDSLVTAFPIRRYAEERSDVGLRVRLWPVEG